jgi:hypothetical protein
VRLSRTSIRSQVVFVAVAAAIMFLVLFGALLVVLYVSGAPAGGRLDAEAGTIRAFVAVPLAGRPNLDFLAQSEQTHIDDVKRLFDAAWIASVVCLGLIVGVAAMGSRDRAARAGLFGAARRAAGFGLLAGLAIVGLTALVDFATFWSTFHEVLFPQGGWRFPAGSRLLRIYPQSYFEGFVLRWVLVVIVVALLLVCLDRLPRPASSRGERKSDG